MDRRSGPAPGSARNPSGRCRRRLLPLRRPLGSPPAWWWWWWWWGGGGQWARGRRGIVPAGPWRHTRRRRPLLPAPNTSPQAQRPTQLRLLHAQVPGVGDVAHERARLRRRLGRRLRRRLQHGPPLGRLGLQRLGLPVGLRLRQLLRGARLVLLEGRVCCALVPVHHHRGALAVRRLRLLLLLPARRRGRAVAVAVAGGGHGARCKGGWQQLGARRGQRARPRAGLRPAQRSPRHPGRAAPGPPPQLQPPPAAAPGSRRRTSSLSRPCPTPPGGWPPPPAPPQSLCPRGASPPGTAPRSAPRGTATRAAAAARRPRRRRRPAAARLRGEGRGRRSGAVGGQLCG
jgi:hypothetical protein